VTLMLQIDWLAGMMNFIANLFMAEGQNWL
jgi:hypothetical protein